VLRPPGRTPEGFQFWPPGGFFGQKRSQQFGFCLRIEVLLLASYMALKIQMLKNKELKQVLRLLFFGEIQGII
jgi:hypothetical protein